jgi:hypothetical protein
MYAASTARKSLPVAVNYGIDAIHIPLLCVTAQKVLLGNLNCLNETLSKVERIFNMFFVNLLLRDTSARTMQLGT